MIATSVSLLEILKKASPDHPGWWRFHDLYFPLIRSWILRVPELQNEAEDLAQNVMVVIVRELPSFERRHDGSFRGWIRRITLNRIRNSQKSKRRRPLAGGGNGIDHLISQLEDENSDLVKAWDNEHDKHVLNKLMEMVQSRVKPVTWQAFTRHGLKEEPAARVAKSLGMTESAVTQAKSRILSRLRNAAKDFID